MARPRKVNVKEEIAQTEPINVVAPVESVDDAPKELGRTRLSEECWNCNNILSSDGKCSNCGFDKSLVYNLELEAEKAAIKLKQQQATK